MSTGRGSGARLGLRRGEDDNLIAGLGLNLDVEIGMAVGMNADSIVNIFSSCCLDIFSQPFTFLCLATFIINKNLINSALYTSAEKRLKEFCFISGFSLMNIQFHRRTGDGEAL